MAVYRPARGRHASGRAGPDGGATEIDGTAGGADVAGPGGLRRLGKAVVLSTVLPGSGHLFLGSRRAGWWIIGAFGVLVAAGLGLLVAAVVSPATAASFAVRPAYLAGVRWGALAIGTAWVGVIVSAALLARPRPIGRRRRALAALLTTAMCLGVALPAVTVSRYAGTTKDVVEGVFPSSSPRRPGHAPPRVSEQEVFLDGRVNVLLVGADSGDDRSGLRADTVILASVNADTGRALLFSLPRNLQNVPFPAGSAMAEAWPGGFDCGNACLLNAVFDWAARNPKLFPGDADPGMTALRGAVSETLGLPVDYHVVVSLEGFEAIIDALGGVRIRVAERLPIGGIDDFGNLVAPSGYLEPGLRTLDGYEALWYARSRRDSTDYARIDRQRCLMGALVRQADPQNVLRNYQRVASSTEDAVETDIPQEVLPELVKLGFRVKSQPIESMTFTPPLVPDTAHPDFDRIRGLVAAAIARADAPPTSAAPSPSATDEPAGEPTDEPPGEPSGEPVDEPVELEQVCAYE